MATKAKQILYSPVDVDDADFENYQPELSDEEIEFEKYREEMKAGDEYGKITVYRQPTSSDGRPGQKKLTYLYDCGIDEFSFAQNCARLRDGYGTGTYRIIGRDSKGRNKFNQAVYIETEKKAVVPYAQNGPDIGILIDKFSEAMERQQERTELLIKDLTGKTGGDAFDQMIKMSGAMSAMMTAINGGGKPQSSLTDQIKEMLLLKKFIGGFDGSENGGGGDDNIYSLLTATVKNIGPFIAAAMAAAQKTGDANSAGIIQPKKLEGPNMQPKIINPKTESPNEAFKNQLGLLLLQAKAGADPVAVAEFVIDKIPEDQLESVEDMLADDDFISFALELQPEFAAHRQWLETWQAEMLMLFDAEFDTDVDSPDTAGVPVAGADSGLPESINALASDTATGDVTGNT